MAWRTKVTAGLVLACSIASGGALAQGAGQFSGVAAYYSKGYKAALASGEHYDPAKFTAAHRTLPFGTHVRVTDRRTHRSVIVVVNDRGPFIKGRVIDLSLAAAKELRMSRRGLTRVTVAVLSPAEITTAVKPQGR